MSTLPENVAVEARAKLMWGESPEKVRAFLEAKGVHRAEAEVLIEEVMVERAGDIRRHGTMWVVFGGFSAIAPVTYYFTARAYGVMEFKFFGGLSVLGVCGLYKFFDGLAMVLRPRSYKADLSKLGEVE